MIVRRATAALLFATLSLGLKAEVLVANESAPAQSGKEAKDWKVIDQDGNERLFFDEIIGSKKAVVNFIYTHCSRVCPTMGRRFVSVQKKLGPRLNSEVVLLTITMDPEHDTAQSLTKWAKDLGAKPGWKLVTGQREDLDQISQLILGGPLLQKDMHAPYIVIKGADGRWLPIHGLASTDEILEKLLPLPITSSPSAP